MAHGHRGPKAKARYELMTEQMLRLVIRVAKRARVRFSIGGAIAVWAHGYKRDTTDVDAFFRYEDRQKVIRSMRLLGENYAIEELDTSHWIAIPEGSPPDERIDLMFATGDPEESAVEMAEVKKYHHVTAPVFPIDLLIVSKYLVDRIEPKDWMDIYGLYKRGLYDIRQITRRLKQMGFVRDAENFPVFLASLEEISKKKRE